MNRQLISVANMMLTVAGAFAFSFFGLHVAYPALGLDFATRMLLGLMLAGVVFFADLYFILKTLDDMEAPRRDSYVQEMRRQESKKER